jgi:hypothetical protein
MTMQPPTPADPDSRIVGAGQQKTDVASELSLRPRK